MFSFFGTGLGLTSEKLLCKLFEMTFEHGVHGGKTSKTTCCLDSTLLKHNGHFYSIPWKKKTDWSPPIFLMICERWNVLIFTFWFPHFFLKKQTEKSSPKTQHWGETSKTKCCLNSTLLNHSGHFYSIPWKNELIDPHLFLQMTCDMWKNYDLHSLVSRSFSKNHK